MGGETLGRLEGVCEGQTDTVNSMRVPAGLWARSKSHTCGFETVSFLID